MPTNRNSPTFPEYLVDDLLSLVSCMEKYHNIVSEKWIDFTKSQEISTVNLNKKQVRDIIRNPATSKEIEEYRKSINKLDLN